MGNWQVGPVNSYIDIYPGWEMEQEKTWMNIRHQRRRNGSLKSYQEAGDFDVFSMPLSWVSSGDRALVNSWAGNILDLVLIPDSDNVFFSPVPSIINGDFEVGSTSGWNLGSGGVSSATFRVNSSFPYEGNYNVLVEIFTAGSGGLIQLGQGGHSVVSGAEYMIRFAARAVSSRTIFTNFIKGTAPFTNYGLESTFLDVRSEWQLFELPFTSTVTAGDGTLFFHLGGDINNVEFDKVGFAPGSFHDVRITNVQEPFTSRIKPYDDFYQGEVVFETI